MLDSVQQQLQAQLAEQSEALEALRVLLKTDASEELQQVPTKCTFSNSLQVLRPDAQNQTCMHLLCSCTMIWQLACKRLSLPSLILLKKQSIRLQELAAHRQHSRNKHRHSYSQASTAGQHLACAAQHAFRVRPCGAQASMQHDATASRSATVSPVQH